MKHKRIVSVITVLLLLANCTCAFALTSSGACAIDASTNQVLFEHNAHLPLTPASMTKVMTAYIIYDKMDQGLFDKSTLITCSKNAATLSMDSDATNVPLVEGEQYSIDELIGAIMLPSACASCTLMGEYISGSEEAFAQLMNEYAASLGLDAYFEDASGLSDNNWITPYSMALLGSKFIQEYPDILNYTSLPYFTFRGKKYNNTNLLLSGKSYEYSGADGLKTGTTTKAGKCLVATAKRDGHRIVGVTMHSTTTKSRYTDITEILNTGFWEIDNRYYSLFADNIKIFIDNAEIPGFHYRGGLGEEIIFAETLANYGFDIHYDGNSRTVYVIRDKQKPISPVPDTLYREYATGQKVASFIKNSDLKVVLDDDGYLYEFEMVLDLGGYAGISVDELKKVYNYQWISADMSGYFKINN